MVDNKPKIALVTVPKNKKFKSHEELTHFIGESLFGVRFNPSRNIISYNLTDENDEAKTYQVIRL